MNLEEQRARLAADLARLDSQIAAVHSQLMSGESSAAPTASASSSASSPTSVRRSRGRSGRGELKAQVLDALKAAGSQGVRVKALAAQLGTKPANIYSWFQSATKRMPQIKKMGEAHYRLEGALPESSTSKAPAKTSGGRRGRRNTRPHSKRGELAARILSTLKAAGKEGMKVRDLSDKLGVKYKNLFIWFATTGKKNKGIKKVGEAHYRLDA